MYLHVSVTSSDGVSEVLKEINNLHNDIVMSCTVFVGLEAAGSPSPTTFIAI